MKETIRKLLRIFISSFIAFILINIFLFTSYTVSFAYDEERATNNLAHDYATCTAYYLVMKRGTKYGVKKIEGGDEAAYIAVTMSRTLTNPEVAQTRVNLEAKAMMDDMDNNWANVLILTNKYASFCNDLLDKPDERLAYWRNKKD